MMKKLTALFLALLMMCSVVSALADTAYGVLKQRIATRSGPGTNYFEPGSFLASGDAVTVHTKVWDSRNEIWWVQVDFYAGGERYRAYTGSWRMNVDLSRVPQERTLSAVRVLQDADVFAGPGWDYVMWNDTVYGGTTGTLLEVEGGYGLVECWNSRRNQMWRVWIDLDQLSCRNQYSSWDDTYPNVGGSYSSGSQNSWSSSVWPEGQVCRITANSGNARTGAGAQYSSVDTVWYGECYTILDTAVASNGVTWYKINLGSRYGWISSGLTNFGKH